MKLFGIIIGQEWPSNKSLHRISKGIDGILVKVTEESEEDESQPDLEEMRSYPLFGQTVLRIDDPLVIQKFLELMEIIEPEEESYCMCIGGPAIELWKGKKRISTFVLHHGETITNKQWKGQPALKNPKGFLKLLAELGYSYPIED
jgi:hypothetical protein